PVAAVIAEDDICICGLANYTNSVRFLAQIGVRGPKKNTLREVFEHGFFKPANAVKGAVQFNVHRRLPINSSAVACPGWLIPSRWKTLIKVRNRILISSQKDWFSTYQTSS